MQAGGSSLRVRTKAYLTQNHNLLPDGQAKQAWHEAIQKKAGFTFFNGQINKSWIASSLVPRSSQ